MAEMKHSPNLVGLSLEADGGFDPVWPPLGSPSLEISNTYYSPDTYDCGSILDTSYGTESWAPYQMQAPDYLVNGAMPRSVWQPIDASRNDNPLGVADSTLTGQYFTDFVEDSPELDAGHATNDDSSWRNAPFRDEATTQQKAYRPAWNTSSKQSSSRSTDSKTHKRRTGSSSESSNVNRADAFHRPRTSRKSSFDTDNQSFCSDGNAKHNLTEKRYRSRLNGQFETLLSALPPMPESNGEKKISKAEVLVLAKEHIRALEREGRDLEGENRELMMETRRLGRILVKRDGPK